MKKAHLVLLMLVAPILTKGQEALINFNIKNTSTKTIYILNNDYENADIMFGERGVDISLSNGKASYIVKMSKPIFVLVSYRSDSTKAYSSYALYLTPGDNLNFSVDTNNPHTSCVVTGKGSNNNQPLIQLLSNSSLNLGRYEKDSLPAKVFSAIKQQDALNRTTFNKYIETYHPTEAFTKTHRLLVQYFSLKEYLDFKGNQKFNVGESFFRNEHIWQAIEDSLTHSIPVSNDEMLTIPGYVYFLPTYITRIKERLWKHPEMLSEYFSPKEAANVMKEDPENLLKEKIINKHFTGKTREFLYAVLFKDAINETEDNLPEIFARFVQKYPHSSYTSYIEPGIARIQERSNRKLTDKMTIIENSDSLHTFDQVLALVEGKTVLLDMWGTWCGPCRSEFSLNADSIKNQFNDKALDYLYIANHDTGREVKWKKLISYYNLTGIHILASKSLTKDIMTKVKGRGFPTYVIIKRDGTFELSEAGYPMDRNILFKQLDAALKY